MYYVEIRAIEVGSEIACGLAIDSTPPRLSCPRNLESNQLTGLLPIQWSRLTNLQHLNYLALEGNHLRGPLSESTIHGSVEALYGPRFNLRDVSFIPFE
mmetsp:Transcript_35878/g.91698  ORF Transcript_35878/g.91698 Transcript_35878/m.91698 type:complete len:99 (+) Transcript_35878:200-496(+)